MPVRSKNLADAALGVAVADLYTTPAGETALIKTITLCNVSAVLATTVTLRLRPGGSDRIFYVVSIPANETRILDTWLVLPPGGKLRGNTTQAGTIITVHGAELEGVAD